MDTKYTKTSVLREPYEKLVKIANFEGRKISKMLEILIENYPSSKKILGRKS